MHLGQLREQPPLPQSSVVLGSMYIRNCGIHGSLTSVLARYIIHELGIHNHMQPQPPDPTPLRPTITWMEPRTYRSCRITGYYNRVYSGVIQWFRVEGYIGRMKKNIETSIFHYNPKPWRVGFYGFGLALVRPEFPCSLLLT